MKRIITKRIYEDAAENDGYRLLVDRIWPRGVSKEKAQLDDWNKEIAPTNELRKWFGHKPERFSEFKQRYVEELKAQEEELKKIKHVADKQQVCLLYGAKDKEYNQAIVLKEVIESL